MRWLITSTPSRELLDAIMRRLGKLGISDQLLLPLGSYLAILPFAGLVIAVVYPTSTPSRELRSRFTQIYGAIV